MLKLNIREAKSQWYRYIEKVQDGEKIVLCKRGVPVAQIVPLPKRKKIVKK